MMAKREGKQGGISGKVPSRALGRLTDSASRGLDALVDLVRLFSEKTGLRGDQIRLQREDVAIEIAKKALERKAIEKSTIVPIPNKVLVPLLEAASNEDINDPYMMDKWSTLLASAATKEGVEPRFISILKELRGEQARLLERIANNNWDGYVYPRTALHDAPTNLYPKYLRGIFHNAQLPGAKPDLTAIHESIMVHLNRPGCAVIDITQFYEDYSSSIPLSANSFNETDDGLDLDILATTGLCRRIDETFGTFASDYVCDVIYYSITELGVKFLEKVSPDIFKDERAANASKPGMIGGDGERIR
jgi:hypothetical protein